MTESLQAASPVPRRRRRAFLFRAGLNLGAIIIAILLAEFYVRVTDRAPMVYPISFGKRYPYQPSANPILGYEFKPDFRDPKADVFRSYPSINADGCRDVERRRNSQNCVRNGTT